ncbi:MAG: imidazoleglycerol-phosphate dehydratase HisB [Eubacterium sp.]|nr:imidazoleglycerol-phosphate dehydratase HisB [Eubacterium sp.]
MRTAKIERNTKETQITVELNLDGGEVEISTGIGFFDHMLTAFGVHGGFGLKVKVTGDLEVDTHHTVEDTGIALGMAFKEALGDMSGIVRYGTFFIPMDEAMAMCTLDISNRPFLVFKASFEQEICGDYETCVTEEFFRAFAMNSCITLHIKVPYGANAHHEIEAIFKAVAHALQIATRKNQDGSVLSTKGVIA